MEKLLTGLALLPLMAAPAYADGICTNGASSTILVVQDWTIKPNGEAKSAKEMTFNDSNHMTETLLYNGDKPVRMINGDIRFQDVLGGFIGSMALDRDVKLAPGSTYVQEGDWGPYTFERLLETAKTDVKATACVKAVVYDDGTTAKFD